VAKNKQNEKELSNIKEKLFSFFLTMSEGWTNDDYKKLSSELNGLHYNGRKYSSSEFMHAIYILSYEIEYLAIYKEYSDSIKDFNETIIKNKDYLLNLKKDIEKYREYYLSNINEKPFTLYLKDLFPNIYDEIQDLIEKNEASEIGGKIELYIKRKEFARIVAKNGYKKDFLLFLNNFTTNGEVINRDSFITEVSDSKG
jgi:hypothetical protein